MISLLSARRRLQGGGIFVHVGSLADARHHSNSPVVGLNRQERCANGLFEIASKIIDDGMSLTKLAAKVMSRGDRKGRLKNYIRHGQASAADVARIAAPVFAIEALEKERPSKRPGKAPAADNVVRLVGAA